MIETSESVPGLLSLLYESYNGRKISSLSTFGINLEVLNIEYNLLKVLNCVYSEIAELSGLDYQQLKSLEEAKGFAKSMGYTNECTSNGQLLEESLIELASTRIKHGKKITKNLQIEEDEPLGTFIANSLKNHGLKGMKELEQITGESASLNNLNFDKQQAQTMRSASLELEKDYLSRWNAYLDRFYNLLDVFSKKSPESESDKDAFVKTLVKWRESAKFKPYGLYDAYTAKLNLKDLERISSGNDASVMKLYNEQTA